MFGLVINYAKLMQLENMKVSKIRNYKVVIERGEDGFFVARVPALPGCVTQAKTYEKLHARVKEAIELCLEVAKNDKPYGRRQKLFSNQPTFIGVEEIAVRV